MYQQDRSATRKMEGKTPPFAPAVWAAKWRPRWQATDLYATGDDPDRTDTYILDFFPYPSGEGLSVGHCRNYVPTCVAARFKRMQGHNVLHPMGWDAFGLPAENYAIRHNEHPAATIRRQAANYRRQMTLAECSYDWSREINSADPAFYRWTQFFFLLLHRRGLAYRAESYQWWCDDCGTILANEQVEDGRCWRCDTPVGKKALPQWFFRITAYADRLLNDLDTVDWPDHIKRMQAHWIGRSEGTAVHFPLPDRPGEHLATYTTRVDTLFGATFIALAPEHPDAVALATPERRDAVADTITAALSRSEIDRQATDRQPSGCFTGAYAAHPLTGERLPIWVADYVLPAYGHGAVMGVPAHDTRDAAFAAHYNLPLRTVIIPPEEPAATGDPTTAGEPFTGPGSLVNSQGFSGQSSVAAQANIAAALAARDLGGPTIAYRLRDWLISRQRYWGAPIPIVHCPDCGLVPVPEDQLPVLLPPLDDYAPAGDGRSPLARATDWVQTTCPACAGPAERETDTMDGFACSSWYFLRFASPHESDRPFDPAAVARWLPVDVYVGGAEHAVLHLLYARFWTKVLADAGHIDFVEPFTQLRNQGVLHAPDGRRMSKSKGNVVTPDEVIARHGTDALRAYILFLGPFEGNVQWTERGMRGVNRFLRRYWHIAHHVSTPATTTDPEFVRRRHAVVRRVTADFEAFKFNTAVAALMEYVNYLYGDPTATAVDRREAITTLTLLLAPIAPFITEEVWHAVLGHDDSVHRQLWPTWSDAIPAAKTVELGVQVDGRLRDRITVPAGAPDDAIRTAALAAPNARAHFDSRAVNRVIIVPGRLVNIVTGAR